MLGSVCFSFSGELSGFCLFQLLRRAFRILAARSWKAETSGPAVGPAFKKLES
jgi:hypothetical protein